MDLPVVDTTPSERADAARNRARILEAAERLFRERGVAGTSMEQIAAEAGVGKGTLFRRFGSRADLAFSLLDTSERELQDAVLSGPPPLGPGAPPRERLVAFGCAALDHLELNRDLMLEAELWGAGSYLTSPPRIFRWLHVRNLVEEACKDSNSSYLADVLLAPLVPHAFVHQRANQGLEISELKRAYEDLVARILASPLA